MPECRVCGSTDRLNRECNYCGKVHCTKHRLPENHDCADGGERSWDAWGKDNRRRKGQNGERGFWSRVRDLLRFG